MPQQTGTVMCKKRRNITAKEYLGEIMRNRKIEYLRFGQSPGLSLKMITAMLLATLLLPLPTLASDTGRADGKVKTAVPRATRSTGQIAAFIKRIWLESPLMLEANAKLQAARNQARADSKWLYNPEVEFTVEDNEGADKTKLVGISQTIDWNGKARAAGRVARFELQGAIAEHDETRQNVAVDLLTALAEYRASKEVLILSAERTRLMERFAALEARRFKAGDIDQSEYNMAQLAFSEALIQHADAESTLGEKRLALDSAIGFSANKMMALPALPGRLPKLSKNGRSADELVARLPAIRMRQSRNSALRASITRAQRDRFADPTLTLTGGKDTGARLIGVSVSIPFNVFNSYKAEVDVAKYRSASEAQSLQSAYYIAKSRLNSSRRKYELTSRAWSAWNSRGSRALEDQVDTLDKKFKVGELSATEYLVQIQQTLNTRIAAEELYSKTWNAWFEWIKVSGSVEQWLQGE